jgi:hypothetical protein
MDERISTQFPTSMAWEFTEIVTYNWAFIQALQEFIEGAPMA